MEHHFYVHPVKLMAGLLTGISLLSLSVCLILVHRWGSAIVLLLLSLPFFFVALLYGAVISIDETGIKKKILGFKADEIRWEDIAKIGVAGTKVFNREHPKRTGSLYIYFSKTSMTEKERFNMMLKWPPIHTIYLYYDNERISAVQMFWQQKIQTYNVGNLAL